MKFNALAVPSGIRAKAAWKICGAGCTSVDIAEQRRLRFCSDGENDCGPVDQLDLEGRPQVLGWASRRCRRRFRWTGRCRRRLVGG